MWDIEPGLRVMTIYTARRRWYGTSEAEPAVPSTIHSKVKLAARNNVYLNYKNMPCLQLIINAIPIAAGIFVKYSFSGNSGLEKIIWKVGKKAYGRQRSVKVAYRPNGLKIIWR